MYKIIASRIRIRIVSLKSCGVIRPAPRIALRGALQPVTPNDPGLAHTRYDCCRSPAKPAKPESRTQNPDTQDPRSSNRRRARRRSGCWHCVSEVADRRSPAWVPVRCINSRCVPAWTLGAVHRRHRHRQHPDLRASCGQSQARADFCVRVRSRVLCSS